MQSWPSAWDALLFLKLQDFICADYAIELAAILLYVGISTFLMFRMRRKAQGFSEEARYRQLKRFRNGEYFFNPIKLFSTYVEDRAYRLLIFRFVIMILFFAFVSVTIFKNSTRVSETLGCLNM